jgi:glutamyl-tRNA reductase
VHGLVTATSVEDLITEDFLKSQKNLRVIADLGLPRNVVPKIPKQTVLIDLEKMQDLGEVRRKHIENCLAKAEVLIQEELDLALGEWAERQLGQAIVQLRLYYHQTLEHIVGERLEPAELNRLANRFAHIPIKGLRGLAKQHGLHVAESFLKEAGLEWEQKDTHV